MSVYDQVPPDAPADLNDKSPNRNDEYVEVYPHRQGVFLAKQALRLCGLCGWARNPNVKICPKCGCPSSDWFPKGSQISMPTRGAVAQFLRKVVTCWNQETDAVTGEVRTHAFVEEKVPVITVMPIVLTGGSHTEYEIHDEVRCKTCKGAYQKTNGRTATAEEIQKFKDGKLSKASQFYLPHYQGAPS